MKRTNFHYPAQLLGRLKAAKDKTGRPMAELAREAIDKFLKEMGL